jgi:pimeloyl-ACP methyl ester carboxylesterase
MKKTQPRMLSLWGKREVSVAPTEPEAYRRDVSNEEVKIVGAGHFALDAAADEIAELVARFLSK